MPSVASDTMLAVTYTLGEHYTDWKAAEKEKNLYKDKFFKMVTDLIKENYELDEEFVGLDDTFEDEDEVRAHLLKYNARYTVDAVRRAGTGWEAILIENPEYVGYSFVNTDDGKVYTKSVSEGAMLMDDERMQEHDPDLYEELVYITPWDEVQMVPVNEMSVQQLTRLKPYLYNGKPTVKLLAPRKAKEEELEGMV